MPQPSYGANTVYLFTVKVRGADINWFSAAPSAFIQGSVILRRYITCSAVVGSDADAGLVEEVCHLSLPHASADGGCLHPAVHPPPPPLLHASFWYLHTNIHPHS